MARKQTQLKAVIYARKSFDEKQDSESILTQIEHCKELCKREGYKVVQVFHENPSGRTHPTGYEERFKGDTETHKFVRKMRKKTRVEFGKVCRMIENHDFDILVVRDTTRIARPKAMSDFINWIPVFFRDNKMNIHSVNEGFIKYDDEDRIMYKIILDSMVDRELSRRAENSFAVNQDRKKKGIYQGVKYYGVTYDKKNKKYNVVKHEAAAVKKMFQMRSKGKSFVDIAKQMAEDGTKRWDGDFFSSVHISQILQKPLYSGLINLGTKESPDFIESINVPKIITKTVFFKCWEIYQTNKKLFNKGQNRAHSGSLLSGLLYCKCGSKMGKCSRSGKNAEGRKPESLYTYYCFNGRHSSGLNCSEKGSINAYKIEQFLIPFTMLDIVSKNYEAEENQEKIKELPKLIKKESELRERRESIIKDLTLDVDLLKKSDRN